MAPNLEPLFSERAKLLKASDVRELLKYSQDPTVISFAGGLPSPEAFPVEDLAIVFEELLHEDGTPSLQYGPTPGDPVVLWHPKQPDFSASSFPRSASDAPAGAPADASQRA